MDGHIYMEVQKGMYGLPRAGSLENQLMVHRLAVHVYHHTKFTTGLWEHVSRPKNSPWLLMTLESSMWGRNMSIISPMLWSNPTQFPKIGRAVYIVALH
jgi:hypothetical protein